MQNETTHSVGYDVKVHLVNAFTRDNSGGNPAGVVLYPPDLSAAQKIAIARQVGFSETAFVYAGEDTDFKVDFFTPEGEVDFCGHATLAVFFHPGFAQSAYTGPIHAKNQGRYSECRRQPPVYRYGANLADHAARA